MNNRARVYLRDSGHFKEIDVSSDDKPEISYAIIEKWQSILDLITKIIEVPAGLIMKIDKENLEVFLKNLNQPNPYKVGASDHLGAGLYCETVVGSNQTLLIPNAKVSEKWKDNPDMRYNMISYLGMPLKWPDEQVFGTICVLDIKENYYQSDLIELMRLMKLSVEADLSILLNNNILKTLSITDPLTKVYNRLKVSETLSYQFEQFSRYQKVFSVILLDIDDFKKINDTRGHLAGDAILQEFAEILGSNIRKSDEIGRWGGEEFLIICPETNLDSCYTVAKKILKVINEHTFVTKSKITISIGISETSSGMKGSNDLVKSADEALYRAKANGKNRIEKSD